MVKSFSTMQIALGASLLVHAVLLTTRFVDPKSFDRIFQDTPLEVILVNAQSSEKPDRAQAIAQVNLAGGGELDQGRARSPLPRSALSTLGDAAEDAQSQVNAMQQQQAQLLAQLKKQLATLATTDPIVPSQDPAQAVLEEKRQQRLKLLAEIDKRISEENARPKKRFISPATREAVYAVYYATLRQRIEEKGTSNFPEQAGKKLYGELTMTVTVNFDGQILATEIVASSGNRILDRRAQNIVQAVGRFERFSAAMRQQADQIVVVSRFKFTRDETLETRLTEPSKRD